ncbi:MAG TPA: hypothetical protein VGU44_01000 [Gammaproteobacteria bacterium]|nr:hypothetical protein [Gammaproteobacteria bacterium]
MIESTPATPPTFDIIDVIMEAWRLTQKTKWTFILLLLAIAIPYNLLSALITNIVAISSSPAVWGTVLETMALSGFFIPLVFMGPPIFLLIVFIFCGLWSGLAKMTIEVARGHSVSVSMGFKYFSRAITVAFTLVIYGLFMLPTLIFNSFHLSILSIIYGFLVSTFFYLSTLFAVDKTKSAITAVTYSFRAIRPHWLKILGLNVLIYMASYNLMIPIEVGISSHYTSLIIIGYFVMLIAMIWLLPFMFLLQGVVYHKLTVLPESESERIRRELKEDIAREEKTGNVS